MMMKNVASKSDLALEGGFSNGKQINIKCQNIFAFANGYFLPSLVLPYRLIGFQTSYISLDIEFIISDSII